MSTSHAGEIEEIASEWLIRRDSGHWTDADEARLQQWMEASPLNRVAFLRLELAWEESARLQVLGVGTAADRPPPPGSWNLALGVEADPCVLRSDARRVVSPVPTGAPRRRGRGLAIAATVVFAVLAGLCGYRLRGDGNDGYSTPVGGLASLPLLDGSKITLNTNSRVHFALTATERRVELQEGEAFFDVAKDPSRPFVVQAGGKRVVAVGTKFSVRRDGDAIEVVVTDGKVRVESATRPVFLTPGAIARADESMVSIEHKSVPEAEAHLSWRRGVLMFRDQSLADAVAEFNRYNARKIVITDPAVAALKVEGNFRATNVDAFVRLLESGFAVRASAVENQIVLEPR